MRILFVSSEVRPFAMTGGLGDVTGSLPKYLADLGHDVRLIMPRYGWISTDSMKRHHHPLGVPTGVGEKWCALWEGVLPETSVPVYFIENNELFDRGGLYGQDGYDYGDNLLRFTVLSRGALQTCHYLGWYPDVIHVHDWQTSLIPVYLNTVERHTHLGRSATVLTIHNLGYQGRFSAEQFPVTGLPWELYNHLGLEAYGAVNLLKGGIYHSTLINTVSPTYAREIQTPEAGHGLDGVLRDRAADLSGILNGIDTRSWNPATDPHIPHNFSADSPEGKALCRQSLHEEFGLDLDPKAPLVIMITRLAQQKGIDLVAEAMERIMDLGVRFLMLGGGAPWAEEFFSSLKSRWPGRYGAFIGFDPPLSRRMYAGADMILVPSRYEPCGLTQMYSMRYGTIPVARRVGGLADSITDADQGSDATGFLFDHYTADGLLWALERAVDMFRNSPEEFARLRHNAMTRDFSWDRAAGTYTELYSRARTMRNGIR